MSGKIKVNKNVVFNEHASWNFYSTNESSDIQLLPSDDIVDQEYVADPFFGWSINYLIDFTSNFSNIEKTFRWANSIEKIIKR